MNNKRVISMEATKKIYHKYGCRFVNNILNQNQLIISKNSAIEQGYRCCRYCNSMNHHYNVEWLVINHFVKKKNMDIRYKKGILYIVTDISLWKLVYSRQKERIAIYHRNDSSAPIDINNLENERFHKQKDILYAETLQGCLNYIYEHDKYKGAIARGEKNIHFSSKRYETLAGKREHHRQLRRIDFLFNILEQENKGYKKLSMC